MNFRHFGFAVFFTFGSLACEHDLLAQGNKGKPDAVASFQWVNPLSESDRKKTPHIKHSTFRSPSLGVPVGFCLYLPPQYFNPKWKQRDFPVVYYLHGGRPGSEKKSIRLSNPINAAIKSGEVDPMIYVFVNGGPVSHYNMPNNPKAQGADVFINELIPHIDMTYRTIANRSGRAIEGFSQGGRGTARLMFRYSELFCSASPGGGGHAMEKRISENKGAESEFLVFAIGDNTWDLARRYVANRKADLEIPELSILVHVGDKGYNYSNNLDWMSHLTKLKISHDSIIVPGAKHSAMQIYEKQGVAIMKFHAKQFRNSQSLVNP
ncbi:alpha/beta hydrolase-fold protein [Rubripirellula sp.]|nr:alpha/beta hydrolase-fold protein [Rubripirellula sp.]MDB4338676.1 alpha/beta hydrolase-fold protein [Rubripirellula sp.]